MSIKKIRMKHCVKSSHGCGSKLNRRGYAGALHVTLVQSSPAAVFLLPGAWGVLASALFSAVHSAVSSLGKTNSASAGFPSPALRFAFFQTLAALAFKHHSTDRCGGDL